MVQNSVPVSSSGTKPVLVNENVATRATIARMTVVSTGMGLRTSVSTFRIAMVLTVLRCADREPMFEPQSNVLVCKDDDFNTALTIANTLINHTCHVYANLLPHVETPLVADGIKLLDRQRQFFIELPEEFVTEVWQAIAQRLNIPIKTAERYLGEFVNKYHLIDRIKNGHYRKRA